MENSLNSVAATPACTGHRLVVQIAKIHVSTVFAFNMQTRPNILPDLVFAC